MTHPLLSLAALAARLLPQPAKQALYRIPPLARLIRASLSRAAPQGLSRVRVAAGALQGMELLLDLQEEKDYWLGTYEPELQVAIAELVQPGLVAYDVGANIGYISLMLAQAVGESGQVFAFEALLANLERLQTHLEWNRVAHRIKVIHAAVVDASRPVEFLLGPSGGMGKAQGSPGRQKGYSGSILVPGLSLDDFVYVQGHPAPQVVKMDIEGGEVLALPGMRRILSQAQPLILLEIHGPEAAKVAWEELTTAGYRLCRMSKGYPPLTSTAALGWKAYVVAMPQPA